MAERAALEKVVADLNCFVCLETYTDPKILQCHHVFCRGCLRRLVNRNQQGQLIVICPICRKVTSIPVGGVADLQAAFHINHLLDILKEHKKATGDARYCPEHPTRELESFCETCDELICLECSIKQHNGHEIGLVNELQEKYERHIMTTLDQVKKCHTTAQKVVTDMDTRRDTIMSQQREIKAKICEHALQLQEAVEIRKVELINKLDGISEDKLHNLASQRADIQVTIAQLSSYLDTVCKSLETSSQGEVVKMKTSVEQQAKELTESFQSDSLKLSVDADIMISVKREIAKECRQFGSVFTSGSPDPTMCRVTPNSLEGSVVGEKSSVFLTITNLKNSCKSLMPSLECELVSESISAKVKCTVRKTDQNQLEISYKPIIKGRHQLHIKVKGQHIKGSPFSVSVKLPVDKLGAPALVFSAEKPSGIAVNSQGELIVAEAGKQCISVFSSQGEKLQSFYNKEFQYPCGVATDSKDNVYVVDKKAQCIWQFDPRGQLDGGTKHQPVMMRQKTSKSKASAIGAVILGAGAFLLTPLVPDRLGEALLPVYRRQFLTLHHPHDVAFNKTNRKLYIVDQAVKRLNPDLTFDGSIIAPFDAPCGIACDSTGKVYVTDAENSSSIQVFTADGKNLKKFSHSQLHEPYGIAADSDGMVYVSQPCKHCISVFNKNGEFVTSFSTQLKGEETNDCGPTALAIDHQGFLYVCDPLVGKVKVF